MFQPDFGAFHSVTTTPALTPPPSAAMSSGLSFLAQPPATVPPMTTSFPGVASAVNDGTALMTSDFGGVNISSAPIATATATKKPIMGCASSTNSFAISSLMGSTNNITRNNMTMPTNNTMNPMQQQNLLMMQRQLMIQMNNGSMNPQQQQQMMMMMQQQQQQQQRQMMMPMNGSMQMGNGGMQMNGGMSSMNIMSMNAGMNSMNGNKNNVTQFPSNWP
jgi:hypothetical protein